MSANNGKAIQFPGGVPALPAYPDLIAVTSFFGGMAQTGVLQRALLQAQDLAGKRRAGIILQAGLGRLESVLGDPNFWAQFEELIGHVSALPRTEAVAAKLLALKVTEGVLPDITPAEINELVRTLPAAFKAPLPAPGETSPRAGDDGKGGGHA